MTGIEPLTSAQKWNLTLIEANRVWQEYNVTGEGIVIGQSDSGVQWDHTYAVRNLETAGVFIVTSAGNEGSSCSTLKFSLAKYKESFTEGAIDKMGELAIFNSIGTIMVNGNQSVKSEIVAPGVDIFSSMPGSTYASQSGTSMAGPHVSGVVAHI